MKHLVRLISIADAPSDDDDERLRKRVGVIAGYLTIVAPSHCRSRRKGIR